MKSFARLADPSRWDRRVTDLTGGVLPARGPARTAVGAEPWEAIDGTLWT